VIPERLCDRLLDGGEAITDHDYFEYTHFSDVLMTDDEIRELPKVWCVGGDGGMGDIGYQNVSKVILQNRPNIKMLMMDTQVYSNTGGQNSDSSVLAGGFDMNQFGIASQGKLTEKKSVSESFMSGHGSALVAQVSMADTPRFYKAILDGLEYRGTAFFQAYTTCQPEHGVGDDMSTQQARRIRDSRGMPEFVHNPQLGETYQETLDIGGNPRKDRDWHEIRVRALKTKYTYTVAHWAATEARFRRHLKALKPEQTQGMRHLDDMLVCITQDDFVKRHFVKPEHRAFVPDFGVYIEVEKGDRMVPMALSRQLVLFCVERRKAWRLLQSKAGIENKDYKAQRALLAKADKGEISVEDLRARGAELLEAEREALA
jgi:pyruvate-ferredoxin/flavodoxin oxidoreductase